MNTHIAVKTRFAPSPTGLMHFGNLRVALFNFMFARKLKGQFLLRVEDTDLARSEAHYIEAISEDLKWMGVVPDEGPYFQSQRQDIYDAHYQKLTELKLLYPCFCTEEQLALTRKLQLASGQPPRYPGTCRQLSDEALQAKKDQGLPFTLRFHVPKGEMVLFEDLIKGNQRFETDHIGDFIVRRADSSASFMFCNAVDDALMGITHALRGDDHLTNTPRQLLILKALGLAAPQYGHFPTILGPDSRPLSKRNGSRSIQELRDQGYLSLGLLNYLARLGHYELKPALLTLEALCEKFDLKHINTSPAHFDQQQLDHWQKEAMHHCSLSECWDLISKEVKEWVPEEKQQAFVALIQPNLIMPSDARQWATAIFAPTLDYSEEAKKVMVEAGLDFFIAAARCLAHNETMIADTIPIEGGLNTEVNQQALMKTLQELGFKGKALFFPLRAALTGETHGPELKPIFDLMGKKKVLKRFHDAGKELEKEIEKLMKNTQSE